MSCMKPEARAVWEAITRVGHLVNVAGRGKGLGPIRRLIWSRVPKKSRNKIMPLHRKFNQEGQQFRKEETGNLQLKLKSQPS